MANAWRVVVENVPYLITPAHIAFHANRKAEVMTKSTFAKDLGPVKWNVHYKYQEGLYEFDLAWAKLDDVSNCLVALSLDKPQNVPCQLFLQTQSAMGDYASGTPNLGIVWANLYPSSRHNLLETRSFGHRDMSGALAVTDLAGDPVVTGMVIKQIPALLQTDEKLELDDFKSISRDIVVLLQAVRQLSRSVLKRSDLDELLDDMPPMRRSLIMPVSHMVELMKDGVPLENFEGKAR